MPERNVLIVEDEIKIAKLLGDYLEKAGFGVSIMDRGDTVVPHVKKNDVHMILLDIMLPEMDGISVCREIRKFSDVPVIMITARVEEVDRLIGLELGADDYICKPFSPREVVARVKAVLRRVNTGPVEERLYAGPIELDVNTRQVQVNKKNLSLTPSEFGLLKIMMANPNRVFSRNELLNRVQGYDFEGYDRTIDTHIKNLRRKIAKRLPNQTIISSVYAVGYKLTIPS